MHNYNLEYKSKIITLLSRQSSRSIGLWFFRWWVRIFFQIRPHVAPWHGSVGHFAKRNYNTPRFPPFFSSPEITERSAGLYIKVMVCCCILSLHRFSSLAFVPKTKGKQYLICTFTEALFFLQEVDHDQPKSLWIKCIRIPSDWLISGKHQRFAKLWGPNVFDQWKILCQNGLIIKYHPIIFIGKMSNQ